VARQLGVAPATLRTWDRRYGIGPSGHTTGRHRRYAPADIARLELMQRALLRGATPAEAAEYALRAALTPAGDPTSGPYGPPSGKNGPHVPHAGATRPAAPAAPEARGARPVRTGGRMLRLPGGSPRPVASAGRHSPWTPPRPSS